MPAIPTLDDVARAAGVSTATVSRCLNEKQKVAAKTRERVMQAVEQLGYTPNFNARAMAAKRSYTIGAIIPTMENAIFARGLQAFQEALHELGYNLLVASSAYQPEREAAQMRALVARGADGLLLIGYERAPADYEFLARRGIPAVLAWAAMPDKAQAFVGFDNEAAMRTLADRVIAMGHRRVGVISGIVDGNDRAADRLKGIIASWQAHGFAADDLSIMQTSYGIDTGADAFAQLMGAAQRPTVVMCGNDVLAAGAIAKAREMGMHVPDDVSITGFDDIELAKHVHPALTTVHVPHRKMGRIAARALVDLIEDPTAKVSCELDVSIVMRGSLKNMAEQPE